MWYENTVSVLFVAERGGREGVKWYDNTDSVLFVAELEAQACCKGNAFRIRQMHFDCRATSE